MTVKPLLIAALTLTGAFAHGQAQGNICGRGVNCPPDFVRPDEPGRHRPDPSPYDPVRPEDPRYPERPGRPDPGYGVERRSGWVNRLVRNEVLSLNHIVGLSEFSDRGSEVESVEVSIYGSNRRFEAELLADGWSVARENFPSSVLILRPIQRLEIGHNLRRLELRVRGAAQIGTVVVSLRRGGGYPDYPSHPRDQVVERSIYQTVYGGGRLDLSSALNLYQYRGYRITSITVDGQSLYRGGASAEVLINSFRQGTIFLGDYGTPQTLHLNQRLEIGRGADSIVLYVNRDVRINRISVTLTR
ncbi:MAG: hypothetical protein ACK5P6_10640 [Pseudobdellovibrionaceae bacterium]|jgi:hypothetical protein